MVRLWVLCVLVGTIVDTDDVHVVMTVVSHVVLVGALIMKAPVEHVSCACSPC